MPDRPVLHARIRRLFVAATLFVLAASQPESAASKPIDPLNLDPSVSPGLDFYRFANGGWIDRNPVPADESRWGSFAVLAKSNQDLLRSVLEEAARTRSAPHGSTIQRVGDLYASAMDSVRAEIDGARPLAGELKSIARISDRDQLLDAIAHLQTLGLRAPFGVFAAPDAKQSTDVIVQVFQGGLGMPDRDYYTKTDPASQKLRDQYVAHMGRMFRMLGGDSTAAAAQAAAVMKIETELANASLTRVQRRDQEANYHKMTLDSLASLTPNLSWIRLYEGMGIADRRALNVGQPEFVKQLDRMIASVPIEDWKSYLRWNVLRSSAEYLSSAFVNENFDFFQRALSGTSEMRPRWRRALLTVDRSIGEALGELYVARTFKPEAKLRVEAMVESLRVELRERIQTLDWMGPQTKQQALAKLEAFAVKIGYPAQWRDYSGLEIDRGPLVLNVMRAQQFEYRRNIAKLGRPVDRKEWSMTPPTVNAYYNSRFNEIVFPAGILQPPFFDAEADDAVNYGGIGSVIGHELTHGFDDQGRKSDAVGNLRDWWTPEDAKRYEERSSKVERQASRFVVIDTLKINGKLTLGENLADLGGVSIAYGALQRSLANKRMPKIDGFTPAQRFFLAYAQLWRQNVRDAQAKLLLNTDPHAPGVFRTNGPLSNLPEFADAFGLEAGAPMVLPEAERARIW
ncbi:MAG: M13 family metallopeptidase [Candidatus Eisenbacteria bacterium]|uniref:M13 family metallopeptidase n=1 Tax=Eiseniibacteriota bacterium TaxID=2212470 RepID=A0A849SAE2_UNCEI|nr:M13 family metallopeptidase [Candidatus Eisenbacteria bacterium]